MTLWERLSVAQGDHEEKFQHQSELASLETQVLFVPFHIAYCGRHNIAYMVWGLV